MKLSKKFFSTVFIALAAMTSSSINAFAQDAPDSYIGGKQAKERKVVIDKPALRIYVIEAQDTIFNAPVCVGKNYGHKQKSGDMRTPEGNFSVQQIQDASSWTHDFHDGGGVRKGAYGPWFIRLKTPGFSGIGIHGTCFPERVSNPKLGRDSEGCIRLLNEDLVEFKKLVKVGMPVIILPDPADKQPKAEAPKSKKNRKTSYLPIKESERIGTEIINS